MFYLCFTKRVSFIRTKVFMKGKWLLRDSKLCLFLQVYQYRTKMLTRNASFNAVYFIDAH